MDAAFEAAGLLADNADFAVRRQRERGMPRTLQLEPAAGMAELVDALDSKSSSGNRVGVRFPLPAPNSPMTAPQGAVSVSGRIVHVGIALSTAVR